MPTLGGRIVVGRTRRRSRRWRRTTYGALVGGGIHGDNVEFLAASTRIESPTSRRQSGRKSEVGSEHVALAGDRTASRPHARGKPPDEPELPWAQAAVRLWRQQQRRGPARGGPAARGGGHLVIGPGERAFSGVLGDGGELPPATLPGRCAQHPQFRQAEQFAGFGVRGVLPVGAPHDLEPLRERRQRRREMVGHPHVEPPRAGVMEPARRRPAMSVRQVRQEDAVDIEDQKRPAGVPLVGRFAHVVERTSAPGPRPALRGCG